MRAPVGVCLAAVLGLLLLPCTSCTDDDNDRSAPGGATPLAGYASVPPSIEGSWILESAIGASTCGFLDEYFSTDPLELQVTQVGNDVAFDLRDACGHLMPSGEGVVAPAGTVTLESQDIESLTPSCSLKLSQVRTGTAGTPPNVITGADVLTISGSVDCGAGLPCTVNGTFTATRCPASGCSLTCGP